jgi:hypothetical protein
MSALPPESGQIADVPVGPVRAISGPAQVQQNSLQKAPLDLLDHLVGECQQRGWDFEPERLCGV